MTASFVSGKNCLCHEKVYAGLKTKQKKQIAKVFVSPATWLHGFRNDLRNLLHVKPLSFSLSLFSASCGLLLTIRVKHAKKKRIYWKSEMKE